MPSIKRSKEPIIEYLEVSSMEILQENVQSHENYMYNNACIYLQTSFSRRSLRDAS